MTEHHLDYPDLLDLFSEHRAPRRSESASFLIWYLQNYYRLDPTEAVDAVCDQSGDRGIDGLYVNDSLQTIVLFQSKISQKNTTVGDAPIREFAGTLAQLTDAESVHTLISTAGRAEVARLLSRLHIADKIDEYDVKGEFLSNIDVDANGGAALQSLPTISFVGRTTLLSTYISDERDRPIQTSMSFDVSAFNVTEYAVDTENKAVIAPIRARELIQLHGIEDQSLFLHNVRGALGRTGVNRAIVKSVANPELHKKFPLFHNGITIIAGQITTTTDAITITDYFVVNGCQSLTSLFAQRAELTDDLYVLSKFIEVDPRSPLATQITEFSNNQNGVRPRDFKANSALQIRLQNEVRHLYARTYDYAIKRGEAPVAATVISNEDTGLCLMAFDLREPWATHRKYQIFEDKHADVFGRPEVDADRIVLCYIIGEEAEHLLEQISNPLFAKYRLTRYLLVYLVRCALDDDELGNNITSSPRQFVRDPGTRQQFRSLLQGVLRDIIADLNAEVDEYGDDFDYRGTLRDKSWVTRVSREVIATRQKLVRRGTINTITADWRSLVTGGAH